MDMEGHYEVAQQIINSTSGRYEVIGERPLQSRTQDYGELYATPIDGIQIGDTLDIRIKDVPIATKPKVCLKTISKMLLQKKKQEDYEVPVDAQPQDYEEPKSGSDAEEDAEGYVVHNRLYSNTKLDIYSTLKTLASNTSSKSVPLDEKYETPIASPVTVDVFQPQQSLITPPSNRDELYMSMHAPEDLSVTARVVSRSDVKSKRTTSDYDLPWKSKK